MLNRIRNSILNRLFFNHFKPKMVLGYKRKIDQTYLKNTRISNTTSILNEETLNIQDNVFIGHFNLLDASNHLTIEEGVQITNFVSMLTHSSHIAIRLYGKHYIENNGQHNGYIKGRTIIGKYSFIGPHSLIMPDVKLGKGTLVSAYSHVKSGEYPDFAILSGNPATITGDTRDLDKEYLKNNKDLNAYYTEWTE